MLTNKLTKLVTVTVAVPVECLGSLQGAIEVFTKRLLRHDAQPCAGRVLADFDIDYNAKLLTELVHLREALADGVQSAVRRSEDKKPPDATVLASNIIHNGYVFKEWLVFSEGLVDSLKEHGFSDEATALANSIRMVVERINEKDEKSFGTNFDV